MWRYVNQNIFFSDVNISQETIERINELGAKVVKLQSPMPVIDIVCYQDVDSVNSPTANLANRQRIQAKRKQPILNLAFDQLQKSMGYDQSLPFARWAEFPKFDPWSGEPVSSKKYNDSLVEESIN